MTDSEAKATSAPLGVVGIIADSFSILFGNFFKVFIPGFLLAFLAFVVTNLLFGADIAAVTTNLINAKIPILNVGIILSVVTNIVIYGLGTALLVQLAYDAKLGRSETIGTYFQLAFTALIPIAILSFAISFLASIGTIALIIGSFWVYAVFFVTVPVIVIERGGFRSMNRSAELTKEYRWPIVGVFIWLIIILLILQIIGGFIVGAVGLAAGSIINGIGLAMVNGLGYAYVCIIVALVYARLHEIKEGAILDQIAPRLIKNGTTRKSFYLPFILIFCSLYLLGVYLFSANENVSISQSPLLNDKCLAGRSYNDTSKLTVSFVNNFSGPVEVVWLNYEGKQVSYGTIAPNQVRKQQTMITHPWAFISTITGDCIGYYNPKAKDDNKRIAVLSDK